MRSPLSLLAVELLDRFPNGLNRVPLVNTANEPLADFLFHGGIHTLGRLQSAGVEEGTHATLNAADGLYASLARLWSWTLIAVAGVGEGELVPRSALGGGTGGSAKDGLIIIQGDYKEKIIAWLKDWGYTLTK